MNIKRITRLLMLLQALGEGRGQDPTGLAKACGVSRRTIFRDIETLREAGVPVEFDREQNRYSIPNAHFLPPTNFSAEEALAIIYLASQSGAQTMPPFLDAAQTAAEKLQTSLPEPLREHCQSLSRSVHLRPTRRNPLVNKRDIYQLLVGALASRQQVRLCYESLTEWDTIQTKLRPYELLFDRRSWYVIGRSSLHKEVRTFNVGRIAEAELLDESFNRPKSFSLKRYLRNAWRLIPEPGPDSNVHVRFEALVARNVAEVMWHPLQQCDYRPDGSLDFRVKVSGLNEISWWVLGYGDQAQVIAPAKLRRIIAQRATNMARYYDGA